MLILAGVSLNAIVGDNGIITNAQNANLKSGMVALEEFLQEKYVENFEKFDSKESKINVLENLYPEYFYIPSLNGIGFLRYIVDSDGNALYLINKDGLPDEIKEGLVGGNAGEKTYMDYYNLNDVYGVTSDLKVYYCANGKNSITGVLANILDNDNPQREVFNSEGSTANMYTWVANYDVNKDGKISAEEVKNVKQLTLNSNINVSSLTDLCNFNSLEELTIENKNLDSLDGVQYCTHLYYLYCSSSVIGDYSALKGNRINLRYLYFYNIDDTELAKICNGIKNADFLNLNYLAIIGETSYINNVNVWSYLMNSNKSDKTITTLEPLDSLSDVTKKAVKYLALNNNNISDGSLEYIKEFTSLISLRAQYNSIKSLNGIENFSKLQFLNMTCNLLGRDRDKDTSSRMTDAIVSIENCTSLNQVSFVSNPDLRYVDYLKNCTKINSLFMAGCSSLMNVNNIANIILACGGNYSLPCKFLVGNTYVVSDYFTPGNVTYDELYSDLYGNTYINRLNINNVTQLTNNELNTILKSMKNLYYLKVVNTKLSDLSFIGEDGVKYLREIDLRGTLVTDLTNLSNYSQSTFCLHIDNNEIKLKNYVPFLNKCIGPGWATNDYGLLCGDIRLYKQLEECKELNQLYIRQPHVGSTTEIIDLSNTKIKSASLISSNLLFILPNTVTSIYVDSATPFCLSEGTGNISFFVNYGWSGVNTSWNTRCFKSLSNASLIHMDAWNYQGLNHTLGQNYYDFSNVSYLYWCNPSKDGSVKSLNFLSKATNLAFLKIYGRTGLQDVGVLKNIGITELVIEYCEFSDLSLLPLDSLEKLTLDNNNISSLKALENNTSLNEINLSNNCIYDTSSYTDNNNNTITYNNLQVLARLNKNYVLSEEEIAKGYIKGNVQKLYLSGNSGIINYSPVSNLEWDDKSGF